MKKFFTMMAVVTIVASLSFNVVAIHNHYKKIQACRNSIQQALSFARGYHEKGERIEAGIFLDLVYLQLDLCGLKPSDIGITEAELQVFKNKK
jgi:predicted membrane protein